MQNVLYLIFALAILFIVIVFIKKPNKNGNFKTIQEKWQEVEDLIKKDGEVYWKMAVIEADKLADLALKGSEMRGKDMGERIRFATSRNNKLRSLWRPHILRNNLVHETHYKLNKSEAQKAVWDFKEGLKILGAL